MSATTGGREYGATAIALHWIVAILIFGNLALGLYTVEVLPLSPQTRQQLLEMTDARARLERLNSLLTSAQAAL